MSGTSQGNRVVAKDNTQQWEPMNIVKSTNRVNGGATDDNSSTHMTMAENSMDLCLSPGKDYMVVLGD